MEKKIVTYKENTVRFSSAISREMPQSRREWNDICKISKDRNH